MCGKEVRAGEEGCTAVGAAPACSLSDEMLRELFPVKERSCLCLIAFEKLSCKSCRQVTDVSSFCTSPGQAVLFYFQLSQGHQGTTLALTLIYHTALQTSTESFAPSRFSGEINTNCATWVL